MQSLKRTGTSTAAATAGADGALDGVAYGDGEFDDAFEMYRVICPACSQQIALLADEDALPEHALCPTRRNPFVLSVCAGTGTAAADAHPADDTAGTVEGGPGLLLTLPQGLDWRTQPFSHAGRTGARPVAA